MGQLQLWLEKLNHEGVTYQDGENWEIKALHNRDK